MDILITGGNGLLGHHLLPALENGGDTARVLVLPGEDASFLEARGTTVVRGDITQPQTLAKAVDGVDAVLHLAGMMGVWRPIADYHAVNVLGTENVCRAALAAGVTFTVTPSSWALTTGTTMHNRATNVALLSIKVKDRFELLIQFSLMG